MKKIIANTEIDVNEEGYLLDFSQWTKEIGEAIAKTEDIEMTEDHWKVIDYIQEKVKNEEALSIRGIKKSGVINIKEFYNLFPGGPLKKSTLIAGVPKPKSCI
ncbi:TusE/DsrC/DsvC family sulfur relay protein [Tenacibaculum tangerinum]|uniref:TusE/DsrC/DsvC family sulfur relay protein n=1 Tax=Tenacibaculum tangerinum TaxID=3038772 RepID=A0ABY8L6N9_9FLAO|nr:TusE/DsrC/DsvC family sulfur relay protein [Tenacibaculum tangerinum]WGH76307.1 TusE/DsrC/DsvC family sulfur relay protein [Tenacibaculum tangerinum]